MTKRARQPLQLDNSATHGHCVATDDDNIQVENNEIFSSAVHADDNRIDHNDDQ